MNIVEMVVEKLDTLIMCLGRAVMPSAFSACVLPILTDFLGVEFDMVFVFLYRVKWRLGIASRPVAMKVS